jgi:3'(2'), 5'-bisphosphate nucleotidase
MNLTRNFIEGTGEYTVNIALIKAGIPVLGLIYEPTRDLMYYTAEPNKLACECNGVSYSPYDTQMKRDYVAVIGKHDKLDSATQELLSTENIKNVIRVGSSIKLCMIACSEADIYPKLSRTMEWDTAAGHALINAAGGKLIYSNSQKPIYGKHGFYNSHFIAYSKRWIDMHDL